jgi:hypothetical protein
VLQRLAQDRADVVLMGFQQRPDAQRRMAAELRDQLTGPPRT